MSNTSNPWFGLSMALIGVIIGYSVAMGTVESQPKQVAKAPAPTPSAPAPTPAAPEAKSVVAPDADSDHIRGNLTATITLIEYSDFECPFCKRHHPTMQQAVDEYDGDVNWVYRHYPLAFHPNAKPSAMASECAAEIGGNDAFWAYSDLIFERGPDASSLEGYAEELGLNVSAFADCMSSEKYSTLVDDQLNEGSASGVSGTPGTIVYNNETKESRYISGAQPYSNVKAAIDALL